MFKWLKNIFSKQPNTVHIHIHVHGKLEHKVEHINAPTQAIQVNNPADSPMHDDWTIKHQVTHPIGGGRMVTHPVGDSIPTTIDIDEPIVGFGDEVTS